MVEQSQHDESNFSRESVTGVSLSSIVFDLVRRVGTHFDALEERALKQLTELGEPGIICLRELAEGNAGADSLDRWSAIHLLSKLKTDQVDIAVFERLLCEDELVVILASTSGAPRLGAKAGKLVPTIIQRIADIQALANHPSKDYLPYYARAVVQIGTDKKADTRAYEVLTSCLKESDLSVRMKAAEFLLDSSEHAASAIDALFSDDFSSIEKECAYINFVDHINKDMKHVLAAVEKKLDSDRLEVRIGAASILFGLSCGNERAASVYLSGLESADPSEAALSALTLWQDSVKALIEINSTEQDNGEAGQIVETYSDRFFSEIFEDEPENHIRTLENQWPLSVDDILKASCGTNVQERVLALEKVTYQVDQILRERGMNQENYETDNPFVDAVERSSSYLQREARLYLA